MRLDELLVARGLPASRPRPQRLILAGQVRLPGGATAKAGGLVAPTSRSTGGGGAVRRAGRREARGALEAFGVDVEGRVCLDVGASTGGFTDCLLARRPHVDALDVGHGQLHPRLRDDPRVVVWEGANARHLARPVPRGPSLATVDVSFISLDKVLPAVARVPALRRRSWPW